MATILRDPVYLRPERKRDGFADALGSLLLSTLVVTSVAPLKPVVTTTTQQKKSVETFQPPNILVRLQNGAPFKSVDTASSREHSPKITFPDTWPNLSTSTLDFQQIAPASLELLPTHFKKSVADTNVANVLVRYTASVTPPFVPQPLLDAPQPKRQYQADVYSWGRLLLAPPVPIPLWAEQTAWIQQQKAQTSTDQPVWSQLLATSTALPFVQEEQGFAQSKRQAQDSGSAGSPRVLLSTVVKAPFAQTHWPAPPAYRFAINPAQQYGPTPDSIHVSVATYSMSFYHQSGTGTVQTGGSAVESDVSLSVSSGFPGTGEYPVVGHGLLITGATSGTAQLRFRAEVADIVTAKAGFTLIIEKVA